ncbi:1-aminocyclopropane-1-carboxylate oxidase 1-like [Gossypium australe]|uniref:1-aminocyclopropane-1-carboxylate oxidase 1-like n=1 Tax=Gossypium australe TaxID=47621 RepID=A0A5B6WVB3_9ROSI|nr:1-aminocyclopropane-1-carboxylate oxidase 1-like [Gossypium australe]
MAHSVGMLGQQCFDLKNKAIAHDLHDYSSMDEIPTIDYSLLFFKDHNERANSLEHLRKACQYFGCFYVRTSNTHTYTHQLLINGVEERVVEGALKGISDFFELTNQEERSEYLKKNSMDRIRWYLRSDAGENRENVKIVTHPEYHCPSKPDSCKDAIGKYLKGMHEVEQGLAKAISTTLGYEETYIEKEFKLEAGFDVATLNLYPPSLQSKGSTGLAEHTDPGFFVSLIQYVNGGLQVLSHKGNWITVNIPRNTIFVGIGDHFEILTNGKYKSHIHQVILDNNEVKRISMAILHGPSLDTFVAPAPGFIDDSHPPSYRGMTYKESLELNGFDEIDVQSSLIQLQMPLSL